MNIDKKLKIHKYFCAYLDTGVRSSRGIDKQAFNAPCFGCFSRSASESWL